MKVLFLGQPLGLISMRTRRSWPCCQAFRQPGESCRRTPFCAGTRERCRDAPPFSARKCEVAYNRRSGIVMTAIWAKTSKSAQIIAAEFNHRRHAARCLRLATWHSLPMRSGSLQQRIKRSAPWTQQTRSFGRLFRFGRSDPGPRFCTACCCCCATRLCFTHRP